jgi:hypothetical protein
MALLKTYPYPNSAILRLNAERQFIDVEPPYQRRSDIWTTDKKQLLIDSILNDYDIPKLYFHSLSRGQKAEDDSDFDYAIIDGRQRLETIWAFIDDAFPLAEDFQYLADDAVNAAGMTYSQLASKYPRLKIRFDSFSLPIVCLETEELYLIEDMFSRLNEAVPLSSAEKRNAIGGPMAQLIRDVADHHFFVARVKFSNRRYQHREVAARILFIEFSLLLNRRLLDTKKPYLDAMVKNFKAGKGSRELSKIKKRAFHVMRALDGVFLNEDPLLRAQAVIPILYLTMRAAESASKVRRFTRHKLEEFNVKVADNRLVAEKDIANANFEWLEYDRMSQQGTNDAASIKERVKILSAFLGFPSDLP